MRDMVLSQLLSQATGDLLLVDEGGELGCNLLDVSVTVPDEGVQVAEVSTECSACRGGVHSQGSLRDAVTEDGEPLGLVQSLRDVQKAGGGRSPLRTQEVEGSLGTHAGGRVGGEALVFLHPIFPGAAVAGHVRAHVQVHVAATQVVGKGELVLVAENIALPPEQLHKLGEAGVVLNKK